MQRAPDRPGRRALRRRALSGRSGWRPALWACAVGLAGRDAAAQNTPGYPERVLQWVVEAGQTCPEIASSLYGSAQHQPLLSRYNELDCQRPLEAGRVLVVPESVRDVPTALLEHATPQVNARPPDGEWQPARAGLELYRRYGVNTLATGTADILFNDRSRIFLAEHTLVIIYQDARSSPARVERPSSVELDSGELQAGLAALHGEPSRVATVGGGRVEATSRDTVLRRNGERTTVSVLDGKARVRSAGAVVEVPVEMGTSFEPALPPNPPRPLPPAPRWRDPPPALVVAPAGQGVVNARWSPVPKAKAYRLELALDREFHQPIVRREVPPDVLSFRAEALPAGRLYARVRAIDDEDFLGLGSDVREVALVAARVDWGALGGASLRASPYARLALDTDADTEISVDGQGYRAGPLALDLLSTAARRLTFRGAGGGPELGSLAIAYRQPRASIGVLRRDAGELEVLVAAELAPDELERAGLRLWLAQSGRRREIALTGTRSGELGARIAGVKPAAPYRLELLDVRGVVLAVADVPAEVAVHVERPLAPPFLVLDPSPSGSYEWWQPAKTSSAGVGVLAAPAERSAQAWFAAELALRSFAISGRLVSDAGRSEARADDAAWLGARWSLPTVGWRMAVGARAALPVSSASPPLRFEPSAAAGSELGHGSWLVNVGSRFSLDDDSRVPRRQVYAIAGGMYGLTDALFVNGSGDLALSFDTQHACGGARIGIGTRTRLAVGVSTRVSPCSDAGWLTLQAGVSVEAF